jgi:hypothetical protein
MAWPAGPRLERAGRAQVHGAGRCGSGFVRRRGRHQREPCTHRRDPRRRQRPLQRLRLPVRHRHRQPAAQTHGARRRGGRLLRGLGRTRRGRRPHRRNRPRQRLDLPVRRPHRRPVAETHRVRQRVKQRLWQLGLDQRRPGGDRRAVGPRQRIQQRRCLSVHAGSGRSRPRSSPRAGDATPAARRPGAAAPPADRGPSRRTATTPSLPDRAGVRGDG